MAFLSCFYVDMWGGVGGGGGGRGLAIVNQKPWGGGF